MPASKNQIIRIRIIDQLIRSPKRRYGREEMLEALNDRLQGEGYSPIALRQLQKDLDFMKSGGSGYAAPLYYNRKGGYYEYTEEGYGILHTPLKAEDLGVLRLAEDILKQFSGLDYGAELSQIIQRLEQQIVRNAAQPSTVLEFEQVPLKGLDLLQDLHRVILHEKAIEVVYQPYHHEEPSTWVVHPYYLKEFNHRWFLFALSDEQQYVITLALDRIESFTMASTPYIYNNDIDFKRRFQHILGVTIPSEEGVSPKIEHIILKFNPKRGNYVRTKPIHATQRILRDDAAVLEISLALVVNPELMARLLSFGADIEVAKPESLKQELLAIYEQSIQIGRGIPVEGLFLDTPVIRQAEDSTDCGPVCVQMLMEYLGNPISLASIKKEVSLFGPEQYSYAPQIGSFLIKQGLKVSMEMINPQLFAWEEQGMGMAGITRRILELYAEAKASGRDYRQQVLQFFIDYIDAGGHIEVKAPSILSIHESIQKGYPVIANLTSHHLRKSAPRTINSHFQLIRGVDPAHIYVNDPSWVQTQGGRQHYPIEAYFYGLAAHAALDMDNGVLLYVEG